MHSGTSRGKTLIRASTVTLFTSVSLRVQGRSREVLGQGWASTVPACQCAKLRAVGTVGDVSQVLDSQGSCVGIISTVPRCHRILFRVPGPRARRLARGFIGIAL